MVVVIMRDEFNVVETSSDVALPSNNYSSIIVGCVYVQKVALITSSR